MEKYPGGAVEPKAIAQWQKICSEMKCSDDVDRGR
jgi:hypothetical protein